MGGFIFRVPRKCKESSAEGVRGGQTAKCLYSHPGEHRHTQIKNGITLFLPSHNGCQAAAPPELENLKIFHILKFSSSAKTCLLAIFI